MKIILPFIAIMFLILTSCAIHPIRQNHGHPKFEQYPVVSIFEGKAAKVRIVSDGERMFRTRLRRAAQMPVNFAGEYVLMTWGCGSGCSDGAVVSRKTGRVTFLPGLIHSGLGEQKPLRFLANSRLLVMTGFLNEQGVYAANYYEFTGAGFRQLKLIPVKEH